MGSIPLANMCSTFVEPLMAGKVYLLMGGNVCCFGSSDSLLISYELQSEGVDAAYLIIYSRSKRPDYIHANAVCRRIAIQE